MDATQLCRRMKRWGMKTATTLEDQRLGLSRLSLSGVQVGKKADNSAFLAQQQVVTRLGIATCAIAR